MILFHKYIYFGTPRTIMMLMIIIARELSNIGAVLNNFTADTRPGELLLKSNGNLQSPIIIIVLIILILVNCCTRLSVGMMLRLINTKSQWEIQRLSKWPIDHHIIALIIRWFTIQGKLTCIRPYWKLWLNCKFCLKLNSVPPPPLTHTPYKILNR